MIACRAIGNNRWADIGPSTIPSPATARGSGLAFVSRPAENHHGGWAERDGDCSHVNVHDSVHASETKTKVKRIRLTQVRQNGARKKIGRKLLISRNLRPK